MASPFHRDLAIGRWIPKVSFSTVTAKVMRSLPMKGLPADADVAVKDIRVSPSTAVRLLSPTAATSPVPVLLWIHGGGHLTGAPEQDDHFNFRLVAELGICVAAVRYRLGVDAPFPASLDDCYAALTHIAAHADELGIDRDSIAVGGASAGGGIAAALVAYAYDRAEVPVMFQHLVYPMLDDRTANRRDLERMPVRIWTPKSNRLGWRTYLAAVPGTRDASPYAAPARRVDLAGLPPAWIGVGSIDLFYDEDRVYAARLREAGVPCRLDVVPGAFHGFDALFPRTGVVRDFQESQLEALRGAGVCSR